MTIPADWITAYVTCPNLWRGDGSYMTDAELNELAEVILKGHIGFDVPRMIDAFDWAASYQGFTFWNNVHDEITNGSRIPRDDHYPQTAPAQAGWQTPNVSAGGGKVLISGGGGGGGIGVSAGSGKVVNGSAGGSPVPTLGSVTGSDPRIPPPSQQQLSEESEPVRAPDIMDITRGMFK